MSIVTMAIHPLYRAIAFAILLIAALYFADSTAQAKSRADKYKEQGDFLYYHGDVEEAIECFKKAIELEPDMVEAYMSLITLYQSRSRMDDALAAARKAIGLKPDNADAHFIVARLLKEKGLNKQAAPEFKKALDLGFADGPALNELGYCYLSMGDFQAALATFDKAMRYKQFRFSARLGHAIARFRLGQQEQCFEELDAAITELDGGPAAVVHETKGHLLAAAGRHRDAIEAYEASLKARPDNANTHAHLGRVHHKMGNVDKAKAAFESALSLEPNNSKLHEDIGNAFFMLGDLDRAEDLFEKAASTEPCEAGLFYALGVINQKQGEHDVAANYFEKGAGVENDTKVQSKMIRHSLMLRRRAGTAASPLKVSVPTLFSGPVIRTDSVFSVDYAQLLSRPQSEWRRIGKSVARAQKSIRKPRARMGKVLKVKPPLVIPGRLH